MIDNGGVDSVAAAYAALVDQQVTLFITLSTIFSTLGARIAFRQFVMAGLTQRIEVMLMLGVVWFLWTVLYLYIARAVASTATHLYGTVMTRIATIATSTFTIFFYLYADDVVQHTAIVSGMTPSEAFVMIVIVIVLISVVQTLFGTFARIDLLATLHDHRIADKKRT